MAVSGRALLLDIARAVREARRAVGWSQRELARRAKVAQPTICRIELARLENVTVGTAARVLAALGVRGGFDLSGPVIANGGRQRDIGHARCVGYVTRRLRRLGWLVETEVEVLAGAARGWIDVLAFRPSDGLLLVIEVKTELLDIGQVQRQIAWYERTAWAAARGFGWQPRRTVAALLVLATEATLERVRANRELLAPAFPAAARHLAAIIDGAPAPAGSRRALAMIDPYRRAKSWLLPSPLAGRVRAPAYQDYAAFAARARAA